MVTINKSVTCFEQLMKSNLSLKNYSFHSDNSQRTSKFLFDTIFRISSGVSSAFGFDPEDDTENNESTNLTKCDCGKLILMHL